MRARDSRVRVLDNPARVLRPPLSIERSRHRAAKSSFAWMRTRLFVGTLFLKPSVIWSPRAPGTWVVSCTPSRRAMDHLQSPFAWC